MDKPIICFVLSVDSYAKFVDSTIIAAASVRALYSDIEIVLITDSHSVTVLENCGAMAKISEFMSVRICDVEAENSLIKSRLLRMSIFDIVDRDFIYLDSDIVALRKFDELWQSDINMGAVSDFNTPPDQPKLLARAVDRFKAMQWEVPKRYFNSGVLVVKANDANREFFRRWREAYDACLEKGLFLDQTSFNRTVELMGDEIGFTPLDNKFNAQVAIDLSQAKKGALIHFWASSNDKPSLMSHLLSRFEKDGTIDYAAIAECGKVGHPWPPNPPAWRLMESRNWWHALLAKLGIRIYKA